MLLEDSTCRQHALVAAAMHATLADVRLCNGKINNSNNNNI